MTVTWVQCTGSERAAEGAGRARRARALAAAAGVGPRGVAPHVCGSRSVRGVRQPWLCACPREHAHPPCTRRLTNTEVTPSCATPASQALITCSNRLPRRKVNTLRVGVRVYGRTRPVCAHVAQAQRVGDEDLLPLSRELSNLVRRSACLCSGRSPSAQPWGRLLHPQPWKSPPSRPSYLVRGEREESTRTRVMVAYEGGVLVGRLGCYGETAAASHPSGAQRAVRLA